MRCRIFFLVDRASPRVSMEKDFGMKIRILLGTLYRFPNDWNDPDRKMLDEQIAWKDWK